MVGVFPRTVTIEELTHENDSQPRRISKKILNTPYSIITLGNEYYAIYRGVKQNCHLGSGGFGYTKLVQNIKSGEWVVLKLSIRDKKSNEYKLLEKVGLGIGEFNRKVGVNSSFVKNMYDIQGMISSNQNHLLMKLAPGISLEELYENESYQLKDIQWLKIMIQVLKAYESLNKKDKELSGIEKIESQIKCWKSAYIQT